MSGLGLSFLFWCLLSVGISLQRTDGRVIVPRDVENELNDIENEEIDKEIFRGDDVEQLGSPVFFDENDLFDENGDKEEFFVDKDATEEALNEAEEDEYEYEEEENEGEEKKDEEEGKDEEEEKNEEGRIDEEAGEEQAKKDTAILEEELKELADEMEEEEEELKTEEGKIEEAEDDSNEEEDSWFGRMRKFFKIRN